MKVHKNSKTVNLRPTMTLFLLIALLLIPTQSVSAASKLKRKDFSKMYGRYGVNFMQESYGEDSYFCYANMIDETGNPKNVLKTYRGVTLGDTRKTVVKKYGKASLKKVKCKSDNLYYGLFDIEHDRSAYLLRKLYRYADYFYMRNEDEYRIRFYYDKKGIVQTIAFFKNYNDL